MMGRIILKWIIGICLVLVLLVMLVAGGVGFIAGTPSGLKFALRQAGGVIPGTLSIGDVEGGLLGHLVLSDISYSDRAFSVGVKKLCLDWEPAALMEQTFHVQLLKVDGVKYTQLAVQEKKPEKEPSGPLVLPDITLPVAIKLDDVQVNGVQVVQKSAEKPLEISRLALSALFDSAGLELSGLEFLMPGASFHLNGRLEPRGEYPLDFKIKWAAEVQGEHALSLNGHGGLSGDLKEIALKQQVSGDVQADILVHARDVLGNLSWDASLKLENISRNLLASVGAVPELRDIRPVAGLDAEGDLKHAQAVLSVHVSPAGHSSALNALATQRQKDEIAGHAANAASPSSPAEAATPGSVTVARSSGHSPRSINKDSGKVTVSDQAAEKKTYGPVGTPAGVMQLDLKANVIFDTLKFDASGGWKGLQWPLAGAPQFVSEQGEFAVTGTPENYTFSLDSSLSGRDIPDIRMETGGSGTAESVNLEKFHTELLDGQVDVKAHATWKPAVSWNAEVKASDINPGIMSPEWPGSLSLEFDTHGKLDKQGKPDLEADIRSLSGVLREKKVSGAGQVLMAQGDITINGFDLGCGSARVDVKGVVGRKNLDLAWNASVPDASELLPGGAGSISTKGRLLGIPSVPAVSGTAHVSNFKYAGSECRSLDTDFSLSLDEAAVSSLKLRAAGLLSGGQEIAEAGVDLKGTISDHMLSLYAVHEAVKFSLKAEHGRFDMEKKRWNGILSVLGFDTTDFGNWNLAGPVDLDLSAEEAKLSRMCLHDGDASVCAQAHWLKQGNGTASAEIRAISFDRFARFLPPAVTELSGSLSADLKAGLGSTPVADLKIAISPGAMTYRVDESRQVRLEYQGGTVAALLDEKQVSADVNLSMGDNGIDAKVMIPRAALEKDARSAPLDGVINLNVRTLGIVTAFVPAVKETEGSLTANFKLGGLVGDPRINGKAILRVAGPDVPMIGLDLDETFFEVVANSTSGLLIQGHMKSGGDSLNVKGSVALDAAKGWPAHVELTGSNFMVVNIPDAMIRISPDLRVDYAGESGVRVRGEVTVPEAEITPREIPAGVEKPSSDVVIVSNENPQGNKPGLPVDANVTLSLLDLVHFKGFGLDCYITGRMTVEMLPGKEPVAHGELRINEGKFRFYGHDLDIEKGIISYAGGRFDNPGVNLLAVREVSGTKVGVRVTGYVSDLDVTGYSTDPSVSSQDAITMLITGKSKHDPGFSEAAANTAAIAGADMMAQQLKGYTGLDHLDVEGAGENSSETRVFAGKDVTEDVTVGVQTGTDDDGTQFVARYHVWKGLDFEMKSGAARSGASLVYTIILK